MTAFENAELPAALKRLLTIRGNNPMSLSPELLGVVSVGDARWPPYSTRRPWQYAKEQIGSGGFTGYSAITFFDPLGAKAGRVCVVDSINASQTAAALGNLNVYLIRGFFATSSYIVDTDTQYVYPGGLEVSSHFNGAQNVDGTAPLIESRPAPALRTAVDFHSQLWLRHGDSVIVACSTVNATSTWNIRGYWDP